MIEVIDNFFPNEIFEELQRVFLSGDISWFWNDHVTYENESYDYGFQLTHILYNYNQPQSRFNEVLIPAYAFLGVRSLIRTKLNLSPKSGELIQHDWHVDYDYNDSTSAILYLNSNDGYTCFKDTGQKVESVSNRLVKFDCNHQHAGSTCTNSARRVVLNINYF